GIRDDLVTGVQRCALPLSAGSDDRVSHTPPAPSTSTSPAAVAKRRPRRCGSGSSSIITTGEPGPRRGLSENMTARAPAPAPGAADRKSVVEGHGAGGTGGR